MASYSSLTLQKVIDSLTLCDVMTKTVSSKTKILCSADFNNSTSDKLMRELGDVTLDDLKAEFYRSDSFCCLLI